jgi:hypothetical protein
MEAILIAIAPAIVSTLTSWAKKLKSVSTAKHRKAILRIIVAILAIGSSVGASALSGEAIDVTSIETLLGTIFVAGSTLVTYYFGKRQD